MIDRFYFRSVYFREPSGVLFELATIGPASPSTRTLEHLGERLVAAAALRAAARADRADADAAAEPARDGGLVIAVLEGDRLATWIALPEGAQRDHAPASTRPGRRALPHPLRLRRPRAGLTRARAAPAPRRGREGRGPDPVGHHRAGPGARARGPRRARRTAPTTRAASSSRSRRRAPTLVTSRPRHPPGAAWPSSSADRDYDEELAPARDAAGAPAGLEAHLRVDEHVVDPRVAGGVGLDDLEAKGDQPPRPA